MTEPPTRPTFETAPARGQIRDGVHRLVLRVYYEDTDASGLVYYANYLRFIERSRTDLLRCLGISHTALASNHGLAFAVSRCELAFLAPGRLDDALEVHTSLLAIGGATITARQLVSRDQIELLRARLRLACIDRAGRPHRLPEPVRAALAAIPLSA